MEYTKPPLTFAQQAELVISRGLNAEYKTLLACLEAVNYYRLSAYWCPFKNSDDTFKEGTSLDMVWRRYRFDRQLRIIIMDAVERVEVAVRSQTANAFARKYGTFAYLDKANLPNISSKEHSLFLSKLEREVKRSKELFVGHFFTKYGDKHDALPLWMAVELIPFGMTFTLFRAVDDDIKKEIANKYSVSNEVMESWLKAVNAIRNICAHHGRLWNQILGCKPSIPRERKHPQWHIPVSPVNDRIFSIILILKYMMNRIAPQSGWNRRVENLLTEYGDIPINSMGFPEDWKESPIWFNEPQ